MISRADVVVIGCGASGMVAAIQAAERHRHVCILEKGDRPGRKILASGNGRCNLMNIGSARYSGDSDFAEQVLGRMPKDKLIQFFHHYGLMITEESEGRMYPASYHSATVLSVLKTAIELYSIPIHYKQAVQSVKKAADCFVITTEDGHQYFSDHVIISCGGAAQPRLGGSTDGYMILESLGHSIVPVKPALVPLTTDSKSISGLSGIRVKCSVTLFVQDTFLKHEEGEVLFTDYGISGICIMQCSRFAVPFQSHLEIDFFYHIFENNEAAFNELLRRKNLFSDFSPLILLEGIVTDRISYAILKQAGLSLRNEKTGELSDQTINRIIQTARKYKINITGTRGLEYAQVSAGGACCEEFNPLTMESRIVPGIYATGEVLNIDGDCGGFNLMFAFSSGLVAGCSV